MTDLEHEISSLIEGSKKLTSIFGYWPTFHDAEILELQLWRGEVEPDRKQYVFPVLTVKVHVWELTNEVNEKSYLVLRHHTLTTLRFHEVLDFRMEGFNQQNAIFGLSLTRKENRGSLNTLAVNFEPSFGMGAEFTCTRMEVVDAVPCAENGTQPGKGTWASSG